MKMLLDVDNSKKEFFIELMKDLKFVKILREFRDQEKEQVIKDLAEAFEDVDQFERGERKLSSAEELLDEL